ncbi:TPA: tail fiber protein, partial [Yersinia enterocolitica]|nr:tail fiber protein [Yersinia enterocolitica]
MQKIGDIPNTRADSNGEFTDGNVAGGVPPTILPAAWFNTIQRELMSVLSAAEIDADSAQFNQVLLSIQKLIGEGIPDIKDASLTQKGIVQLSSSITSTNEALAATPKAVKTANDAALQKLANLSDLANVQTALANLTLTAMGIGLPSQPTIENFDFQTSAFTSGANYIVSPTSWINVPSEISYPTGLIISIKVDYVSGNQIGLEIKPSTVSSTNFRAWYLLIDGYPGSRTFTAREIRTSANPIPVNGGGTGATTAAGALVNLGLGEGSLIPIGVPLPYPLATAPTGYLKCNGSSFSTTTYPQLAVAYPSGVLPDLRAFTIRGWDDGRGIDTGRTLLSEQQDALQNITGSLVGVQATAKPSSTGAFLADNVATGYTDLAIRASAIINISFDAGK